MKRFLYFTLSIFLFSSCVAYQSGTMSASSVGANVIYEDLAIGSAISTRVFGLGGMRKDALILEARRQMIAARPLKADEEYQNMVVDIKNSFIVMVHLTKVTVTADVVKHVSESPTERYSNAYKEKAFLVQPDSNYFSIGNIVFDLQGNEGLVLSNLKNDRFLIQTFSRKGEIITKKTNSKKWFGQDKLWGNYQVGDTVLLMDEYVSGRQKGTIIGLNEHALLFKNNKNETKSVKFKFITSIENGE